MQDYNLGPSISIGSVGDKYDPTATYAVGDYCIHDDKLYKCNTAISTAEVWNDSHWTDTTIAEALQTIPSVVDNLTTNDGANALSAAQGKALNGNILNSVGSLDGLSDKAWANNANLNNYTVTGYYPIGQNPTNAPNNIEWCILEVVAVRQDTIEQYYNSYTSAKRTKYFREYRSGAWSSWEELALNSKIDDVATNCKMKSLYAPSQKTITIVLPLKTWQYITLIVLYNDDLYNVRAHFNASQIYDLHAYKINDNTPTNIFSYNGKNIVFTASQYSSLLLIGDMESVTAS